MRRLTRSLFFLFGMLALVLVLTLISNNATADDHTWKATSGNLATTAANWENGSAPASGDDIYFTSLSTAICYWDYGTASNWYHFYVGVNNVVQINSTKAMYLVTYAGDAVFENYGTIIGAGTIKLDFFTASKSYYIGNISCVFNVVCHANPASNNDTLTLLSDITGTSTFSVYSDNAVKTINVDLNGHTMNAASIAVGVRGILSSSVAGARIVDSGPFTVSANGRFAATNIHWITCGGTWDTSAGYYWPSTGQVNMTNVGNIKLAAAQYFYDLRLNAGYIYTLTADCTVQHQLNLLGGSYGTPFIYKINGSFATPFVGNGSSLPIINITSTAASYTIYTNYNWAGTVQMQKNCTVKISNGGQLAVTQGASPKWYNVTMKAWAGPSNFQWYAGSTNAAANLTFTASGLLASTTYEILLDGILSSYVTSNGAGVATFYHTSWSHHLLLMDQTPTITTLPVTVDSMAGIYRYDANASEAVTWAITCSDPDIDIDANGVVSGYLSTDAAITISIRATDASGGVVYQNYTVTVHGPMTDLAPMMTAIIPVIALIVIVMGGMASIQRRKR